MGAAAGARARGAARRLAAARGGVSARALRSVKGARRLRGADARMRQTFECYVRTGEGSDRFQAVTCVREEIIERARALLAELDGEEVEVCQFGSSLFRLGKAGDADLG